MIISIEFLEDLRVHIAEQLMQQAPILSGACGSRVQAAHNDKVVEYITATISTPVPSVTKGDPAIEDVQAVVKRILGRIGVIPKGHHVQMRSWPSFRVWYKSYVNDSVGLSGSIQTALDTPYMDVRFRYAVVPTTKRYLGKFIEE